jgi:multidrug efflux pump subunit AcrB
VLKYRFATLLVMIATLVASVWLYITVPKGFFPVEDTGFINITTEGPSDVSYSAMLERTRQVGDAMLEDPAVAYIRITVGSIYGTSNLSQGRIEIVLKPRDQREPLGVVMQ